MPHRSHERYKRFTLQTTFGSWDNAIVSDVLAHEIAREIGIDYLDYRPVAVFINGEYWGIQIIRDKIDERYVAYSNNLNEDSVEIRGFYNVPFLFYFQIQEVYILFGKNYSFWRKNQMH